MHYFLIELCAIRRFIVRLTGQCSSSAMMDKDSGLRQKRRNMGLVLVELCCLFAVWSRSVEHGVKGVSCGG